MNYIKDNKKISWIKKYYKKDSILLELAFLNYEKHNLYIILTESRKYHTFRLSWFDLDSIKDKTIAKYLSCQTISSFMIAALQDTYAQQTIQLESSSEFSFNDEIVVLRTAFQTKDDTKIEVSFQKYLPVSLLPLSNLFFFVFSNLPKEYNELYYELFAEITETTEKYEYKREFDFDLFRDDLEKLFQKVIIQRGKKYWKEERVLFLEKIGSTYFAVVEGTEKYIVMIKYNDEKKRTQVSCSCPCEFYCKHIYAVILAIRNNAFRRFYKIMLKNSNQNLLELVENFEYFLCLGLKEKSFEIINHDGCLETVPILDENGKYNWEILEDSEDETLKNQVKKLKDKVYSDENQ